MPEVDDPSAAYLSGFKFTYRWCYIHECSARLRFINGKSYHEGPGYWNVADAYFHSFNQILQT
jgi:hypothetical protein